MFGCVFLPHIGFRRAQTLKSPQEMHQVPRIVWLNHVCKRGHRSAVHAGDENAIEGLIGLATLESRTRRKLIRTDRIVFTVGKSCRGRADAMAGGAGALRPLHLLTEIRSG